MDITFPFNFSPLRALLPIASRDGIRYVLNGIFLELHPGKPVNLVACDGRRLVAHNSEWTHTAKEAVEFIVPADFINSLKGQIKGEATFDTFKKTVSFNTGGAIYSCKALDGQYPKWRQVVPSELPQSINAKALTLNMDLLEGLTRALRALKFNECQNAQISCKDEVSPVLMANSRTTAVLMPLKAGKDWLGDAIKNAALNAEDSK